MQLNILTVFLAAVAGVAQSTLDLLAHDRQKLSVYENQCDPPFKAVDGGYCYFLAYNVMKSDWHGAQLICSWLHPGGKLAEFETLAELIEATIFLSFDNSSYEWAPQGPWIGAIEVGDSNEFVWASTNASIQDTNWSASKPNSPTSGDGVVLDASNSFEWIDMSNNTSLSFLCETEPNPPPTIMGCPEGFFRLGESCYAVFDDTLLNWNDAQMFCASLVADGRLVELETAEEIQLLTHHLATNGYDCNIHYWTGGEETSSYNSFKWASTGLPVVFYNWYYDRPSNSASDTAIKLRCAHNWQWYDENKSEGLHPICETSLIEL